MYKYLYIFLAPFILFLALCTLHTAKGQTLNDAEVDSLQHIVRTSANDSLRVGAYNKLAFHFLYVDDKIAKDLIDKGLQEAKLHKLKFGESELLNTNATYFEINGQKEVADSLYKRSLAISRKHHFKNREVTTLNSLGLLHWKTGSFDSALSYFFLTLEINDAHFPENKENKANYLSNIGLIYQELHQHQKAIAYHLQSLRLRQQHELINGQAISHANLGVCFQNLTQYDSAEIHINKAISKAEEAQNWWMYYSLHDNLGNIYNLTNRNELAIEAYKKSLNKPENIRSNPKSELSVYGNLASLYNKLNNPKKALEYGDMGLKLLNEYPLLYAFSGGLYFTYAESNYMLGNIDKGSAYMFSYRNLLDSIFSLNQAVALADIEEKYASSQKDKALLEQQQIIQIKELRIKTQAIWLISAIGLLLFVIGILFFVYKRKQSIEKQSALELKLAEEEERSRIHKERLRISRELHDNIGSYLTLINASIESLPEMSPHEISAIYPDLQKSLSLSMRELRKTVWLLNNQEVSVDALALRLRDFYKPLGTNGTCISVEVRGDSETCLTDIQATHLFRIIQEAVSNAYKYAKASQITILLDTPNNICFSIIDNGIGFDIEAVQKGNGLQNMRMRVAELKGNITITSKQNQGTSVYGYF